MAILGRNIDRRVVNSIGRLFRATENKALAAGDYWVRSPVEVLLC
jgi:hypothetical protein